MAVKEGPVPPFPEGADADEYDRLRRRVLWKMPSGLYVVGSTDKAERRNGMTLNWATQVSFDPKWLGIGVEQDAFTHELIAAGGVFSLCIIDREDRAIVRKFTKPVEVDLAAKTLNEFPYLDGPITGAPGAGAVGRVRRVRGAAVGRGRQPHAVPRRGRQRRLPQARGHRGPPHGGHADELRRLTARDS